MLPATSGHDHLDQNIVFPCFFLSRFDRDGGKGAQRHFVEHQADNLVAGPLGGRPAARRRRPSLLTVSSTLRRVAALMRMSSSPLNTKDIVDCDTPTSTATSFIVTRGLSRVCLPSLRSKRRC